MFERCFECRQWFFIINGGCTGLFGQFFPAVIEHERDMEIAQWCGAERLGEQYLPRRVVYQIRTAHDVGDALVKIVNDDGKLIGPKPVGALQNKISHGFLNILQIVA